MKAGDIVRSFMTEQIGIIIRISEPAYGSPGSIRVMWTTQGLSMFPIGSKEWCSERNLEVVKCK